MSTEHAQPLAVLDDDVRFIRMVERILQTDGIPIQPVTTPDLDEAVEVVAMTDCRAALVDIYIYGEAAGFHLIEKLRDHPATSDLPLIVTSGAYREIARNVPFLKQHRCTILPKPFGVDTLLARVHGLELPEDAAEAARIDWDEDDGFSLPQHSRRWLVNPLKRIPDRIARTA